MFHIKNCSVIFSISCICVFGQAVHSQNIDIDLLKSINPQFPNSGFWKSTSSSYILVSGTATLGSLAHALIKNDRDLRYKSYGVMIGIGINVVATVGLKKVFRRTRPYTRYPNDVFMLTPTSGYSFPSGHTSLAFATATSLMLAYKKWYITVPAYMWAGAVGYSRMYLGKHYPSDVLGGIVVGAGSSYLGHWLNKKYFQQQSAPPKHSNQL